MKSIRPVTMAPMHSNQGVNIKSPGNRVYIPDGKRATDYDFRPFGAARGIFKAGPTMEAGEKDKSVPKNIKHPEEQVIHERYGMGGAGGLGGGFGGFEGDLTKWGKAGQEARTAPAEGTNLDGAGVKLDRKQAGLDGVIPSDLNRREGQQGAGYLGRGKDWEHW